MPTIQADLSARVARRDPRPPLKGSGQVLLRLLAYHVLVIAGGALLVVGVADGYPALRDFGIGVLVAGLATLLGVLAWTASLAWGAARQAATGLPPNAPRPPAIRTWICPRCTARAKVGGPICRRCGATMFLTETKSGTAV